MNEDEEMDAWNTCSCCEKIGLPLHCSITGHRRSEVKPNYYYQLTGLFEQSEESLVEYK